MWYTYLCYLRPKIVAKLITYANYQNEKESHTNDLKKETFFTDSIFLEISKKCVCALIQLGLNWVL